MFVASARKHVLFCGETAVLVYAMRKLRLAQKEPDMMAMFKLSLSTRQQEVESECPHPYLVVTTSGVTSTWPKPLQLYFALPRSICSTRARTISSSMGATQNTFSLWLVFSALAASLLPFRKDRGIASQPSNIVDMESQGYMKRDLCDPHEDTTT